MELSSLITTLSAIAIKTRLLLLVQGFITKMIAARSKINWSVVRKAVGYLRYDCDEQLDSLNELYEYLSPYTNYFQPVLKLVNKKRLGTKVKKTYDLAQTPYQRFQSEPDLTEKQKVSPKMNYDILNPVALKRNIYILQEKLFHSAITNTIQPNESQRSDLNYEYISF